MTSGAVPTTSERTGRCSTSLSMRRACDRVNPLTRSLFRDPAAHQPNPPAPALQGADSHPDHRTQGRGARLIEGNINRSLVKGGIDTRLNLQNPLR